MQVLVSGSTGLVGRALTPRLRAAGHEVTPLVRPDTPPDVDGVRWDPAAGELDAKAVAGVDAVVHLAGESIDQRWTDQAKRRILESRVQGTRLLAETLASLDEPPSVMVSASAVGYYGDRGDTWLPETAASGDLFISRVCREWEAATEPAAEAGVRVVTMRTGIVLSTAGGALARMLSPFRFGLGGRLGSGEQFMPWVTRADVARTVVHLLEDEGVEGPVNACSPNPVRNAAFTKALGRELGRPTVVPLPAAGVRLLFGQMGEELLLASDRVRPAVLEDRGFEWEQPEIEPALAHVLSE